LSREDLVKVSLETYFVKTPLRIYADSYFIGKMKEGKELEEIARESF